MVNKILKPTILISIVTIFSRLIGYLRDIIIAFFTGTSSLSDLVFITLKIFSFVNVLFGYNQISPPLVRVYTKFKNYKKEENNFINFSFSFFIFSSLFIFIIVSFVYFFSDVIIQYSFKTLDDELSQLYSTNLRIIIICCPIIFMESILIAILRTKYIFVPVSFLPIIINFVLIFFLLISDKFFNNYLQFTSFALVIATILQLIFLTFFIKFRIKFLNFKKIKFKKEIFETYKALILSVGLGVLLLLTNVYAMIVSSAVEGNISYIYYSNRIYYIVIDIFGASLGYVVLTRITELIKQKETIQINHLKKMAYLYIIYTAIPFSIGLYIFSDLLIQLLFQRGNFDEISTYNTSIVLKSYLYGIPALAYCLFMNSLYMANSKYVKLFYITFIYFILCIFLIRILFNEYGVSHIGYSLSISAWVYAFLLSYFSKDQIICMFDFDMILNLFKTFIYSIGSLSIVFGISKILEISSLKEFVLCILIAIIIYFIFLFIFEKQNLSNLKRLFN